MKRPHLCPFLIMLPLVLGIFSCSKEQSLSFQKETLFSLSIGKMEDELHFFHLDGAHNRQYLSIYMRNGLFYIGNSGAEKVMQFNSYGDILALFYNEKKNPMPVLLSVKNEEETVSNREAYPYAFNEIGTIAVTGDRILLVQDEVSEGRGEYDEQRQAMLDQIILRFDRKGNLLDFIGQEGIGGTPFPYIDHIQVSARDDIIVFSRTASSWLIFWYTGSGDHLYTIELHHDKLPGPAVEGVVPHLDTVFADHNTDTLYMKLDYYVTRMNRATNTQSGIEYHGSRIYTLDVQSEQYARFIEVPKHFIDEDELDVLEMDKEEMLYEFLGVTVGGHLFLLSPAEGSYYELLILNTEGRVVERIKIVLKDTDLLYRTFSLSQEGILTALLCEEEKADVAWWRCDQLLEQKVE